MAEVASFVRTEEQSLLAATLREMLAESTNMDLTRDMSLTRTALDTATWHAIREMGLVGLTIPPEYGGAGSSTADLAVVFEELGRVIGAVPLLSTVMASTLIEAAGTDDQKSGILPGIASGETIATVAVFETAHETSLDAFATTAERNGDGWRVRGVKRFVSDAIHADVLVVAADVDGLTQCFIVPSDTEGVSIESLPALDATRTLADVSFDVRLSDAARLSADGAPGALQRAIDLGVVLMAQEQVGGAERCLEMSVEYAKTRFQFGRAIGSFQAIKHRCADMLVAVEHARSVAWHAAVAFDDHQESAIMVPLAKSVCSDAFLSVAGDTIQVHGGIGFTWEHDAHLYLKRAKSSALLLGSVGAHRDRLADAIGI